MLFLRQHFHLNKFCNENKRTLLGKIDIQMFISNKQSFEGLAQQMNNKPKNGDNDVEDAEGCRKKS